MTTRKRYPTPTRHGDWRLINGQLVDASRHETPTASDANGSGDGAGAQAPAPEPSHPEAHDGASEDESIPPGGGTVASSTAVNLPRRGRRITTED
jgi:hypothetical protein